MAKIRRPRRRAPRSLTALAVAGLGAAGLGGAITGPAAAVVPPDNLTVNPSFEADVSGWEAFNADLTRVLNPDAPDGTAVAELTRTGASSTFNISDSADTVPATVAGTTYVASAEVRAASASATGKPVTIRIRERNPDGDILATSSATVGAGAAFAPVEATAVPAPGNRLDVLVFQAGAASGDVLQVDLITLVPEAAPAAPPGNAAPSASFTVAPAAPIQGEEVTFSDTSTDDGTVTTRAWDLDGDGAFDDAVGETATFSYPSAGDVTVGLRVTDEFGVAAQTTQTVTIAAPPAGGEQPIPFGNLVANPSFETGASGWEPFNATLATVTEASAPNGDSVAQLTFDGAGTTQNISATDDALIPVSAGTTYVGSAWVRAASPGAVAKQARLQIREIDPSGAIVAPTTNSEPAALTGSFARLEVSAAPTVAGSRFELLVVQSSAAAGDVIQVDLVTLAPEGAAPPPSPPAPGPGPTPAPGPGPTPAPGPGPAPQAPSPGPQGSESPTEGSPPVVRPRAGEPAPSRRGAPASEPRSRRGAATVELSVRQLRINQRISQAAVRRVNALAARFEGRPAPRAPESRGGEVRFELSAAQLRINQRISQAAVRRVNALAAQVAGERAPAPRGEAGTGRVTLSATQLLINQRISQAAIRRIAALSERIDRDA